MKRIALLLLIAFTMMLATACGAPTPTATQAPATEVAVAPPPATEAPAVSTQVDIKLADNTIEASQTTFQVGVPYTFVIANTGRHAHNLNINVPVSVAGSMDAALSGALLSVDQKQLSPGASMTVEYTFPESAAGQLLEISCLIKKHYNDGMKLDITVTK